MKEQTESNDRKDNNKKGLRKKLSRPEKWQSPKSGGKNRKSGKSKEKTGKAVTNLKRLNEKELKSGEESNAGFRPEKY